MFQGEYNKKSLNHLISSFLNDRSWKLYDIQYHNSNSYGIIKVKLNEYKEIIRKINENENSSTISSSGKIRLIRRRYEIIKLNNQD